ncbi:MAG TPA: ATP-binding protein [Novosphingobium sp.]|nr:ATP-binding protein [Novosphingobium sp.]
MQASSLSSLGRDERTNRLIALLLAIGFLGLVGATVTAWVVQRTTQHNASLIAHTFDVEARINAFNSANERAETSRRGYLLSPVDSFKLRMQGAQQSRDALMEQLAELTRDNPVQQARIAELRQLVYELDALQDQSVTGVVGVRDDLATKFSSDRAVALTRQIRDKASEMLNTEQGLLLTRQDEQSRTIFRFNLLLMVTTVLIVALSAATLGMIRRNLADLRRSRNELNRLNDELEDLVDLRTEALRRANAEIQRFAYIVSHDLRAPLVNVMGFTAELEAARETIHRSLARLEVDHPGAVDKPARTAIEEDLPEAIGFIRSSTRKMDRLINSILKLSREGRRTLTPEPIDVNALVEGIIASLRHKALETGTTFSVGKLPAMVTDRLALEQILSNIIENAVKYLRPEVPGQIQVDGVEEAARTIISVRDNGRGIDPKDHQRVFELFRRAGNQDQPGEGIGLAHVRALAHRLGGTINVESTPGVGSTFQLTLPHAWQPGESHA